MKVKHMPVEKTPKEDRVDFIVDAMRRLVYEPRDNRELAQKFGVSPTTVAADAMEAARVIRLGASPDMAGARCIALMEEQIQIARENGDGRLVARYVDLYAKVNNVYVKNVDVNVTHDVGEFNPRAARAEFYQKNNRIGDMTDTLNVEVLSEKPEDADGA